MNNFKLKYKKLSSWFVACALFLALVSITQGGYLLIKAHFAQYLLAHTWQKQQLISKEKSEQLKPWPWADFYPVAKLEFNGFNTSYIVLNNDSGHALAFGPGVNQFNLSTKDEVISDALVISAHNDTHFAILKELTLGDEVTLVLESTLKQTFRVNDISIVDLNVEQLVLLTDPRYRLKDNPLIKELILVTCYPFDGVNNATTLRYVVHLN